MDDQNQQNKNTTGSSDGIPQGQFQNNDPINSVSSPQANPLNVQPASQVPPPIEPAVNKPWHQPPFSLKTKIALFIVGSIFLVGGGLLTLSKWADLNEPKPAPQAAVSSGIYESSEYRFKLIPPANWRQGEDPARSVAVRFNTGTEEAGFSVSTPFEGEGTLEEFLAEGRIAIEQDNFKKIKEEKIEV